MGDAEVRAILASNVERGAAILDQARPGWVHIVALDRLAMASCDSCLLGQIFGAYGTGRWALDANYVSFKEPGSHYGWDRRCLQDGGSEQEYRILGGLWRALIRNRLVAGGGD